MSGAATTRCAVDRTSAGISIVTARPGALVRPCIGELETAERYYFVYRAEAAQNPDVRALRDWVVATFAQSADEAMSAVA